MGAKEAKEEENRETEEKLLSEINQLRKEAEKAKELKLKIETFQENEKKMQQAMEKKTKALEEQKKNIDRLVEERFREMVIKNANDRRKGTFLEIKSGMDKRAEEKRLVTLMRQKEHEKKFAEKKSCRGKS